MSQYFDFVLETQMGVPILLCKIVQVLLDSDRPKRKIIFFKIKILPPINILIEV